MLLLGVFERSRALSAEQIRETIRKGARSRMSLCRKDTPCRIPSSLEMVNDQSAGLTRDRDILEDSNGSIRPEPYQRTRSL